MRLPLGTCLAAFLVVVVALGVEAQSARTVGIDVLAGTLDARPLSEFTIDQLTNLLGPPSAVQGGVGGITGPQVHYHDAGLSFWFEQPSKGERITAVTIYLSKSWDKGSQKHYQQFAGELMPAVDENWKEEKIVQLLAEHSPEVKSGEQQRREAAAAGIPFAGLEFQDVVRLRLGGHETDLLFDATTKSLERISLGFRY
jgi:hypothetical protein